MVIRYKPGNELRFQNFFVNRRIWISTFININGFKELQAEIDYQ